jgi:crossover junction endodeoxyribonuclease RusA
VILTLPFPPSVNSMFLNVPGRGRAPTPEYRAWKKEAALELMAQRARPVEGVAEVRIDLDDRRRGDADNRTKAVLDLLVEQRVLRGDSKKFVKRVSVGWETVAGCRVSIITQ